ncbi:hypothetical protein BJY04DRAFT_221484 [Aspergillus karnatakaensis]|uniref:uncharacterized protein n=1 Tax=Aspergillus karnatakaensis TaxID=1810916 RepID=UPI003CCE3CDC
MQFLLSLSRITVGVGFLTIPQHFATLFSMPFTPEAAIGCRMAGGRDIVLGSLLYLAQSSPKSSSTAVDEKKTATNLIRSNAVRTALLAGIVCDALDVLCCIWCYADGSLPGKPAVLLGGGAGLLLDLGLYLYIFN